MCLNIVTIKEKESELWKRKFEGLSVEWTSESCNGLAYQQIMNIHGPVSASFSFVKQRRA